MTVAFAKWRRSLVGKSSYFDKIAPLSLAQPQYAHECLATEGLVVMGFVVKRSHLLAASTVVAQARRYRQSRSHAPGLLLLVSSVG